MSLPQAFLDSPPAPRYMPSAFLWGSAALHVGALLGVLLVPGAWAGWLALVVANHAAITGAGLLPRCRWLGPNLVRLPAAAAARGEVALTFDDGPDPATTPHVLDMLDAAGMRATFFCIGEQVQRHPALAREIVRRGHALENHTQTHPHAFSLHGPRRMAREVAAAQRTLAEVAGRAPRFFRAVAGLRNPFLQPVLVRHGLHLASWTRRAYDTRTSHAATVLARLTRGLAAGDILLLHDGHAARTPAGEPVVLAVLPGLIAALRARGLRSVTLAAACQVTPAARAQAVSA
ncbi:MAG: polysaccharide deacetylase family protein [Pseudomonadota bacterium]|nr:polysaccharide deacetylase family protein [Pseudomonadota bacterium]